MNDTSTQDQRVMAIVQGALKLDAKERENYLRAACSSNRQLYLEATEAIAWESRMGRFLKQPMLPAVDENSPFVSGELLSLRFEIIQKLGEGGMGAVYQAFDHKRRQTIAIKVPKAGFGKLLSPELEAALRVRHPNVCLVNEIHTTQTAHGNIDFLTMEHLDGEPLSQVLAKRGPLPSSEATEIARQLCSGLMEAHRSGVIHRDLKASNVMLCKNSDGGLRAVITDFGLSGQASRAGFFGTQRYMAPELLLGQRASKASDIFALGVILYEIVNATGEGHPDVKSQRSESHASRAYNRLVADFLSLQPERRTKAFKRALPSLSQTGLSRRTLLISTSAAISAAATGTFLEWDKLEGIFEPLPAKRFVALFSWPPSADPALRPLLGDTIDAIENRLSRSEAADHNLFVISAREVKPNEPGWLVNLGQTFGVNLALQASARQAADTCTLDLKLIDISSAAVIRERQVVCPSSELLSLSTKAASMAAGMLNVHLQDRTSQRINPGTGSPYALRFFQAANESRKTPNDDGLLEAIENYKKAIDADPSYAAAYAKLASAYLRLHSQKLDLGALDLARANALKAIQLDGNSAEGHLAMAMFFNAKSDFNNALSEMHAATKADPANPHILPWTGQIYWHFKRWDDAERTYRQLQSQRPNYWVAYNDLGAVLTNTGRYQEAIQAFRVAATAAPRATLAFNNLGALYFKLGQLAQAEDNYRHSIGLKPDSLTYLNLAETLRVQGRYSQAVAFCHEAAKLTPAKDEVWLGLGDALEAMGGHEQECQQAYRTAASAVQHILDVSPDDGCALTRLALYQAKSHLHAKALRSLQLSEQHGPLDLDTELLKVRAYELLGQREQALRHARYILSRGPLGFQINCIQDLKTFTNDSRYLNLLRHSI